MSTLPKPDQPLPGNPSSPNRRIRWWPAALIALGGLAVSLIIQARESVPFQQRNLETLLVALTAALLLIVWWLGFSRTSLKLRLVACLLGLVAAGIMVATFRIQGVTGDLVPILEPRWRQAPAFQSTTAATTSQHPAPLPPPAQEALDYPQFLGPDRTAILPGPPLDPDWATTPPRLIWRRPVGAAWSGFALTGHRALTQEQQGDEECVTCYDAFTGERLWIHPDPARYATTLAGEGPRCTPTIVSNRVYTLGATGLLNCFELESGRLHWQRDITQDAVTDVPEWGFSGSPLVYEGRVVVSAGGTENRSLLAYRASDGSLEWTSGSARASYSSPFLTHLAGVPQILSFNSRRITAHDPSSGRILWEYPWGDGHPQVAVPVVVGTHRVLFSSGYGVGSELLELTPASEGRWTATRIWRSRRMKAKFANLVARDGFLYGLDDGIFACIDLADGSLRWKEGRYGHGQGLWVDDLFLLMSEAGDLVLLRPTPQAPDELHQFPVFDRKSWNPIALAGDWLLVRNDREAAALRLPLRTP